MNQKNFSERAIELSPESEEFRKHVAESLGLPPHVSWEVIQMAKEKIKTEKGAIERGLPRDADGEYIKRFDIRKDSLEATKLFAKAMGLPEGIDSTALDQIVIDQRRKQLASERGLPIDADWETIANFDRYIDENKKNK